MSIDAEDMPEGSGVSTFPVAAQLPVVQVVEITNMGDAVLTISSIAWKPGGPTGVFKNDYVSMDVGAITLPLQLLPGSVDRVMVNVVFTPPPGGTPLADLSSSILVIESNSKDAAGTGDLASFELTFDVGASGCSAVVNPTNYTFVNATPSSPEEQIFQIDVGWRQSASCTITSVALTTASAVYQLMDVPSPGTVVPPPTSFTVRYTPTGGGNDATTNAVVVSLQDAPAITVPLNASTTLASYSLAYNHRDQFDFSAVSAGTDCRRLLVLSEGPGPMLVNQPQIEPAAAQPDLTVEAYLPPTGPTEPEQLVQSWPRALATGKSIEFEVCYDPPAGGPPGQNAQLLIPIGTPDPGEVTAPIVFMP